MATARDYSDVAPEVRRLAREGWSTLSIARELSLSLEVIRSLRRGISTRPDLTWLLWLEKCDVPREHIRLLMGGRTDEELEAIRSRPRRGYADLDPMGPPRRPDMGRSLLGQNGTKTRILHELRYSSQRIAELLDLDPADVADFIRRTRPIRRAALSRPREPAAQARIDQRRRHSPPPPAKPRLAELDWKWRDDVGPDGAIELPERIRAAEPVDLVDVESRPAPAPWTGPTTTHATGEQHGSAKLDWPKVREVRRLRLEGVSMYALARRYGVAENTIRAIVLGRTWVEV
jgi:hypothetical protein